MIPDKFNNYPSELLNHPGFNKDFAEECLTRNRDQVMNLIKIFSSVIPDKISETHGFEVFGGSPNFDEVTYLIRPSTQGTQIGQDQLFTLTTISNAQLMNYRIEYDPKTIQWKCQSRPDEPPKNSLEDLINSLIPQAKYPLKENNFYRDLKQKALNKENALEELSKPLPKEVLDLPNEVLNHPAFHDLCARRYLGKTHEEMKKFSENLLYPKEPSTTYHSSISLASIYLLRPLPGTQSDGLQKICLSISKPNSDATTFGHFPLGYNSRTKEWSILDGKSNQLYKTLKELILHVVSVVGNEIIIPLNDVDKYSKEHLVTKTFIKTLYSARKGDLDDQEKLANLYSMGMECEKDLKQALTWRLWAADHGSTISQLNLGLYFERQGQLNEALKYFEMAAEKNTYGKTKADEVRQKLGL